eukprot:TRINITY_DN8816_c0_g1_i1.p1 TRINITY_DN8816_c0_g1~~TRINITY_DN8816_c0_g1_i1.p1  ORF type:complete len:219 (+),score=42.16 TRINITY_DN8816_c0_g1_i1:111-767(+)
MFQIYLIRHGQAVSNINEHIGRMMDSVLTPRGVAESNHLGSYFKRKGISFDKIYSSPIKRARETAALVCSSAGYDQEIFLEGGLMEIDRGSWDGVSFSKLLNDPKYMENPPAFKAPGGESEYQVQERISSCIVEKIIPTLKDLTIEKKLINIAMFSHGVAIRSFLSYVLASPIERWRNSIDNTAVSVVVYDGKDWIIKGINSTHHLEDVLLEKGGANL